jgi:hypothetical protein
MENCSRFQNRTSNYLTVIARKKSIEVTDVKTLDQAPFLEYRHESDQAFFLQMSFACIGTRGDPKAKTDGGKSG